MEKEVATQELARARLLLLALARTSTRYLLLRLLFQRNAIRTTDRWSYLTSNLLHLIPSPTIGSPSKAAARSDCARSRDVTQLGRRIIESNGSQNLQNIMQATADHKLS
eukprot:3471520-Pleurochrysis_carterae.AAC.1